MSKSVKDGFHNTDLQLNPPSTLPDIQDIIQQTLSRLLGWDNNNRIYRSIASDELGRLVVTEKLSGFPTYVTLQNIVTTSPDRTLNKRKGRILLYLHNLGAAVVSINTTSVVSGSNLGIFLFPGEDIYLPHWENEVWLVSNSDTTTVISVELYNEL